APSLRYKPGRSMDERKRDERWVASKGRDPVYSRGDGTGESRPIAYFFTSTIRLWISVFPVFSTASDSAPRHHASPGFLVIVVVFPSDPVSVAVPGVIEY